jgi:hypothetical protein
MRPLAEIEDLNTLPVGTVLYSERTKLIIKTTSELMSKSTDNNDMENMLYKCDTLSDENNSGNAIFLTQLHASQSNIYIIDESTLDLLLL